MKEVIAHLESISRNLDEALRDMQGPAVWNDLANRANRNASEQEARCKRGACYTADCYYVDEKTAVCQFCDTDEFGRKRNRNGDYLPK